MNQRYSSYRLPYLLLVGLFGVALSVSVTTLQGAPAINKSEVRSVQQNLKDNGYYNGNVDGLMGPQTRDAIRKYQKAESLPVTGRLDSPTAAKLGVKETESQNPEKQDLKQAGKSVKKGGKKFGHEMSKGKPVAAGKEFGKSVGHAAKKTGQAVKKAASPKD